MEIPSLTNVLNVGELQCIEYTAVPGLFSKEKAFIVQTRDQAAVLVIPAHIIIE